MLTLSFDGFVSSYENHHWTECSCMVFTCGVVLGRKPQGISWMHRPNPARPLSLWCILLLFLRLRKLRSMILCGLRYHIPAHATRLGFAHGSLLCCWTWTTRIFHPRAGLLEDFQVHYDPFSAFTCDIKTLLPSRLPRTRRFILRFPMA